MSFAIQYGGSSMQQCHAWCAVMLTARRHVNSGCGAASGSVINWVIMVTQRAMHHVNLVSCLHIEELGQMLGTCMSDTVC
jgi:hypothetical protein